MKVLCTQVPAPVDGMALESSPWVTSHTEYAVVSLLAEPRGRVQLQIVTDDGHSLAWFDSANFITVDSTLPTNWVAHVGEGGLLELGPKAWLAPGFWEAYYDGDPTVAQVVETELRIMLDEEAT